MTNDSRKRRSAYMPLLGFVLVAIIGAAAWYVAPTVISWLAEVLPFFRGTELTLSASRLIFTAIIVGLALLVLGIFAALIDSKDPLRVKAAVVERDRQALRRQQKVKRAEARKPKGQH